MIDYYSKPNEINKGDFLFLARPEANFSNEIEILEIALSEGIYIGKFKKLLTFINNNLNDANADFLIYLKTLKGETKYKRN